MATPPTYSELAQAAGISPSYANEILSGSRTPSRPLAIHIFRRIGWKHDRIGGLTDEQLDMLEAVDPWTPRQSEQAAA